MIAMTTSNSIKVKPERRLMVICSPPLSHSFNSSFCCTMDFCISSQQHLGLFGVCSWYFKCIHALLMRRGRGGPIQMLVQKIESSLAMDLVVTGKPFNDALAVKPQTRFIEETNLGKFGCHHFVRRDAVEV